MPNFSTPEKINSVISTMKTAEIPRALQRATLNDFFNGKPLWTEDEAKENRITVNFNDKAGSILLHTARSQYENALMGNSSYCNIALPDAPADKQSDWGHFITREMNRYVAKSRLFFHTQDEVFGSVVLHGPGVKIWWDSDDWCPSFVGMQDLLIPTDTDLTMSNLQYFAVRRKMRPGELFRKTLGAGENMAPGWNTKEVCRILDEYKELNQNPHNYDWTNNPEQMAELYKENGSYYDSDSAPVIYFWDFYHLEESKKPSENGWYKKIILENSIESDLDDGQFVYSSETPCSSSLEQIVHFQFGDGNNVPPFKFQSIRSLAFLTYELLWTMNRLRCQWTQHVFEQMLTLFRVQDPADRSRLNQVVMDSPWGVIPEGLNMVSAAERYAVDPNLVGELRSEYQSLVSKSTTSYTQDPGQNPSTEKTKFEVQAIMSSASALMGSMLRRAVKQEAFAAIEICRRFTKEGTLNFDCKKFQAACKEYGIPEKWIDSSRWDVEIEQKLGGGNRMMEIAEANQLMERVNQFDPEAQTEIKHRWVLATTGNPILAKSLSNIGKQPKVTDSIHDSELVYGTLMQGIPVSLKEGINHIDACETILKLMTNTVQQIMQSGGVGAPQQVLGLQLAAAYVGAHIQLIEQDPAEGERVKQYKDVLGKLMNEVKGMEQRQQEAAKAQQAQAGAGQNGEVQAKIQGEMLKAQTSAQIKEAQAAQKLKHNEQKFRQKQQIDMVKTASDLKIQDVKTAAEIQRGHAKAGADVVQGAMRNSAKTMEE